MSISEAASLTNYKIGIAVVQDLVFLKCIISQSKFFCSTYSIHNYTCYVICKIFFVVFLASYFLDV